MMQDGVRMLYCTSCLMSLSEICSCSYQRYSLSTLKVPSVCINVSVSQDKRMKNLAAAQGDFVIICLHATQNGIEMNAFFARVVKGRSWIVGVNPARCWWKPCSVC